MPLPLECTQAISWGYYGQQFCPNVDASAGDFGVLPVAFVSAPPRAQHFSDAPVLVPPGPSPKLPLGLLPATPSPTPATLKSFCVGL